jgi:hypothetical protein
MEGQQSLFKGRDKRSKGWFWMDNEYLNGYAKYFGPVGTAIYVSLCRHANHETQKRFPAMELIAEEVGTSSNTVKKYIALFAKYRLISVERERDRYSKKWLNNVYTTLDKEAWIKPDHVLHKSQSQPVDVASHSQPLDNKEAHREGDSSKETHILAAPSAAVSGKDVQELIDLFQFVNPSYEQLFKNTTQRAALQRLITKHGREKIEHIIQVLPKTNAERYAPTITIPYELEVNLSRLAAYFKRQEKSGPKLVHL